MIGLTAGFLIPALDSRALALEQTSYGVGARAQNAVSAVSGVTETFRIGQSQAASAVSVVVAPIAIYGSRSNLTVSTTSEPAITDGSLSTPKAASMPGASMYNVPSRGLGLGGNPSLAQCANLLRRAEAVPSLKELPDYEFCKELTK